MPPKPISAEVIARRISRGNKEKATFFVPVEISITPLIRSKSAELLKNGLSDDITTEKSTVKPHTSKMLFTEPLTASFIMTESGFETDMFIFDFAK